MFISPVNNQNFQISNPSFTAIGCTDRRAAKLITSAKKHLNYLEKTFYEQEENPVDIYFHSKHRCLLTATLSCIFSLQNFKAHYVQKPIIESRIAFIKRVVRQANIYKAEIQAAAKLNPEPFLQHRNLRQKQIIMRLIKEE